MVCAICGQQWVDSKLRAIGSEHPDDRQFRDLYGMLSLVETRGVHSAERPLLETAGIRPDGSWQVCNACHAAIVRREVPRCALINDLNFTAVPPELADLTLPEQTLISQIRLKMNVLRFECDEVRIDSAQQRGIKGHCIAFPQVCDSYLVFFFYVCWLAGRYQVL